MIDMKAFWEALIRGLGGKGPSNVGLFLICVVASGCVGTVLRPLNWQPIPSFSPPPVEELVSHSPATLLQGEAAPWDGVLVAADDLNALLADRQQLIEALSVLYEGRIEDRGYATEVAGACQTAVKVCRDNQPRVFLAGVGAGAGGCGIVVGGVSAATR